MIAPSTRLPWIAQDSDQGRGVAQELTCCILAASKQQQEGSERVKNRWNRALEPNFGPAELDFRLGSVLSEARAGLFNPHSQRCRVVRGFVQPGSI